MNLLKNINRGDIMKCPKCGQEMIDCKDFCPSCGYHIKEEKPSMTKKTAFFIILLLVIFGVAICLSIIYLGAGNELEPFLNK
jgi:uncharacterized protein (DUF983 family)